MDAVELAVVVVIGLMAGVLSGMFGVGGAVITTPGIRAVGTTPIEAVGSTIPAIVPGAISGAYRYAKADLIDWRVGVTCGVAGSALAVAGAWTSDVVDARWLMVLTAGLLGWSGVSTIRSSRRSTTPSTADGPGAMARRSTPTGTLAVVGAVSGFVAGLLGVGGGVIMMPLFTSVLKIPVKTAVASSLVAVAMFSVPALVAHTVLDHIDWAVAAALVGGTVVGAQIGARLTIRAADETVRVLLGVFFIAVALVYGAREIVGLL